MKDFPLYVNQSSEGNIAPAEVTLPADLRVCFKADDKVNAQAADGSGTLTIMPIAWDEHPNFDLYVKVSGHGY
ncbi:hypothetical protein G5599_26275, partial [Escherichia coli]|uniref:hypothetical protein n=1 Tax=Escherichia coli TaxID=562 RepID=UPI0013C96E12